MSGVKSWFSPWFSQFWIPVVERSPFFPQKRQVQGLFPRRSGGSGARGPSAVYDLGDLKLFRLKRPWISIYPFFLNHGKSIMEFPYRKMLRSSCQLSCPFCRAWFIFDAPRMEFYQEALEMFEKGLEKEPGLLRWSPLQWITVIFDVSISDL